MDKGYVQVYTGNGKGKTSAALGLVLRASAAGLRIFFAQFIKAEVCSEHEALAALPGVTLRRYGRGFVIDEPCGEDMELARLGIAESAVAASLGEYDIVVLDEINPALGRGLVRLNDLIEIIKSKHPGTELVLTGRGARDEIIEMADLVTEMRDVKHYYSKGVMARRGIEK